MRVISFVVTTVGQSFENVFSRIWWVNTLDRVPNSNKLVVTQFVCRTSTEMNKRKWERKHVKNQCSFVTFVKFGCISIQVLSISAEIAGTKRCCARVVNNTYSFLLTSIQRRWRRWQQRSRKKNEYNFKFRSQENVMLENMYEKKNIGNQTTRRQISHNWPCSWNEKKNHNTNLRYLFQLLSLSTTERNRRNGKNGPVIYSAKALHTETQRKTKRTQQKMKHDSKHDKLWKAKQPLNVQYYYYCFFFFSGKFENRQNLIVV